MESTGKNVLSESRKKIDRIDQEISRLFIERMDAAKLIGGYKKEKGLRVFDPAQEKNKMNEILDGVPADMREYTRQLYGLIFELSKSCQNKSIGTGNALTQSIEYAIENTPRLFPTDGAVACQGVEGANSQTACERLIKHGNILYFANFDSVFSAVEKGLCDYGVIPLENSTAGSVNEVYDLMQQHSFSIVKSVRVKIDHDLMALPGTKLTDIKEIYSHEQALSQCSEFIQCLKNVSAIACKNTALAAKMVAESGRKDIAAISAPRCARLYGLNLVKAAVQNRDNNYTRFICISKKLEIYPGADRTSIMLTLPNDQGALYKLLSKFYAAGINLIKLESRPIPDRDFEFRFYFDLDVPVYSPEFMQLMGEISAAYEGFSYLGSYSEII